jgi:hypothetical protein
VPNETLWYVHSTKATEAYNKYREIQSRIEKIEERAKAAHGNLAESRLKTADEYWKYRDLCVDRERWMKVATLEAQMATMYK